MSLTNQEVYEEVSSCDKVNLPNAVNSILERDWYKVIKVNNRILIVDVFLLIQILILDQKK